MASTRFLGPARTDAMENQRLFLYIALAAVLFLIVQAWQRDHSVARGPSPGRAVPLAPAARSTATPAAVPAQTATKPVPGGATVRVTTDVLRAELNTRGADLRHLVLRRYLKKVGHRAAYRLFGARHHPLFYTESGLIGNGRYPTHKSLYDTAHHTYRLAPGQKTLRVRFRWNGPNGVQVVKTYTFTRGSYLIRVTYHVTNRGTKSRSLYLYAQFLRTPPPKPGRLHSAPIYLGGAFYTPTTKYRKITFSDMAHHNLERRASSGWVAMSQHYFVGAWVPEAGQVEFYSQHLTGQRYVLGYKTLRALTLAPGASGTVGARLFAGPKQPSLLDQAAPGLGLTVDYGWLTVLAVPLYWVLAHIEHWVGNWGFAIVLLTAAIKLAFFPLSAASYRSMAKMRRLQPRLDAIKERHGNDRQRVQQAMIELYRTEKLNPLGGCLPMLVQIPVFIALYWVLLESVDLRQAPFILWIHDLSAPDPYFVLPILMGLTMGVQQLLNPTLNMDPLQRKIMLVLPAVFTIFFLFFPAGLVLYWVVSNLLSILQQWWITRLEAPSAARS
ncbi:MAG: membrane protein insertase YidC [Acidiferrobacteraceae bacterium]